MTVTTRNIVRLEDLERRPITDGMGHVEGDHWQVFTKDAGGTEALRLLVQEYPPGGYTTNHPVHNDFEQTYYVMSGEMRLTLDGEEHTVRPGPSCSFRVASGTSTATTRTSRWCS